jgi:hypothetical protein
VSSSEFSNSSADYDKNIDEIDIDPAADENFDTLLDNSPPAPRIDNPISSLPLEIKVTSPRFVKESFNPIPTSSDISNIETDSGMY